MTYRNYLFALLTIVGLGSCSEEDWGNKQKGDIAVKASFAQTRTTFTEDNGTIHVNWKQGDEIALFSKEQSFIKYKADQTGATTLFSPDTDKLQAADGETVYACYPYPESGEGRRILLPNLANQTYAESASQYDVIFTSGEVKERQLNLQFKHLFAFLKLIVPTELIADCGEKGGIMISCSGQPIATSQHYLNLENGSIEGEGAYASSIHYLIPQEAKTEGKKEMICYVALLPQPEGVTFSFAITKKGETGEAILVKKSPAGGFKAGNVYSLYLEDHSAEIIAQKERDALVALYKATNGDQWTNNSNWCSDRPLSEWYGISVNASTGRVEGISLVTNNLNGPIPEEIADLQALNTLSLPTFENGKPNKLKSLPERIGELTNLQELNLCQSEIGGKLPEGLRHLTKLSSLNLHGYVNFANGQMDGEHYLTGDIPEWIGELKALKDIDLSCNHLTGAIPSSINQLQDLHILCLNANELSGPIPAGLGKLPLRTLVLVGNNLTGSIPADWAEMIDRPIINAGEDQGKYQLADIAIGLNQLTGVIPDEVVKSKRFAHWAGLLLQDQQKGYGLDFSSLKIPAVKNTYATLDGTATINLGEAYAKSDYTLLFRWTEWCPYSQQVTPQMIALEKRYRNHGLQVIGVYGSGSVEERNSFMARTGLDQWRHIKELTKDGGSFWSTIEEPIWQTWFGYATPLIEVVDREGHISFISDDSNLFTQLPVAHSRGQLEAFLKSILGEGDAPQYYTSTDYSRDGETIQQQQASVGQGIDLLFMGEAFVDKDMGDGGLYEQKMNEAMEQFFSIEPYKSFRNRFNIFMTKVVSPNAEFASGAEHRLNQNDNTCFEYWKKATGVNQQQPPMIAVIYNHANAGRSYTTIYSDRTFVGYMMEGVNVVLNHEIGGHGFGNLLDEYIEPGNEQQTLPKEQADYMDYVWTEFGWGANVDWRNDPATVKWSHFLNDSRYAGEGLGLFEGSFLYGYGAYRPTENSMMRFNDTPFNAPSREQIYKRIMQMSEGSNWQYDYETFVTYDAINRIAATRMAQLASEAEITRWKERHHAPVFKKGTWRDALKQASNESMPSSQTKGSAKVSMMPKHK